MDRIAEVYDTSKPASYKLYPGLYAPKAKDYCTVYRLNLGLYPCNPPLHKNYNSHYVVA